MTVFDKDNNAAPQDSGAPEKNPMPGANLSAMREGGVEVGAKKSSKLPMILLLLATAAGGYYAVSQTMMMLPPELPPAAATTATDQAAVNPDTAATPATDTAAATDLPAPDTAAAPATDAAATSAPAADGAPAAPATDTAAAAPAVTPAPTEIAQPPAENMMMAPAAQNNAQPAPGQTAVAQATANAAPAGDLPVPTNINTAPATDTAPVTTATTTPAATTPGTAPSPAEMAIVQNSAVLDQLSQPAGAVPAGAATGAGSLAPTPAATPGTAQEAIIRPLPKQYLVVKKNHDSGDIDSRLTAARVALNTDSNAGALQLFNELYKDYPRDHRVMMGRAVAMQKTGDGQGALDAYEEVLNEDPKNLEALTNMLGLLKAQDPALAVEKLTELQAAYPYSAEIAAQLGIAHAGQGSYEQAAKYLDIAEALKPGSAFVLYNKAVLFDKMGKSQAAGELYRQILRLNAEGKLDQQLPLDSIRRRLSTLK